MADNTHLVTSDTTIQKKPENPLIKCPTHCRQNCAIRHHPLLVAILNCSSTADADDSRLTDLKHVINHYVERGWQLTDPIPDSVSAFRLPLLHWAASLGCCRAVEWLIGQGVSSTLTSSDNKNDTALHRALLSLQETCPQHPEQSFRDVLNQLKLCMLECDVYGNSPLHSCAYMLVSDMPDIGFYTECFANMLRHVNSDLTPQGTLPAADVLGLRNLDGDTVLHVLAQNSTTCYDLTKCVLSMGSRTDLTNNKGETPLLKANNCGQNTLVVLISEFLDSNGGDPNVIRQTTEQSIDEDMVKAETDGEVAEEAEMQFIYTDQPEDPREPIVDGLSGSSETATGHPLSYGRPASTDSVIKEEDPRCKSEENTGSHSMETDQTMPSEQDVNTPKHQLPLSPAEIPAEVSNVSDQTDPTLETVPETLSSEAISFNQTLVINVKTKKEEMKSEEIAAAATEPSKVDEVSSAAESDEEDEEDVGGNPEIQLSQLKFSIHRGNSSVDLVGVEEILSFLRNCDVGTWQAFLATVSADTVKMEKALKATETSIADCERDLSALTQKEVDINSSFMSHVMRLKSLHDEEEELTENVRVLTEKLKNNETTQSGLLDRLANCQAALGVLEEMQKPGLRLPTWPT